MRIFAYSICLILALAIMPGCGKKEKVADNQPAAQNNQANNNNNNAGNQPRRNVGEQIYDKKGRPLPSVGGGENGPGPSINANTSTKTSENSESSSSASNTVPMDGGLANGLFPQMGAGNLNPSKLGGGLFPQATNSSTGGVSSGATSNTSVPVNRTSNVAAKAEPEAKEVSSKGEFFDNASAEFKRGNSEKAMKYLYAYALSSDDALDEYPMKWHAGIKRPRIGLRWGVGIVRGSGFDGRAPVIGEGVESSGGRGSGNSDDEPSIASGGRRPGGASTEQSIYEKVDTSTPNGLLLYYTGDFGAQVVSEFASRRKSGAEFGKIFKDMPEVMPEVKSSETENANQTASTPPRDNRIGARARRNRQLPSVGGGGAPGAAPGGRPGAQAGTNQSGNSGASSLVSRWTTGNTPTPRNNTVGELTPGLTLLGVGDTKTIAQRAVENNIDCLLLIKINGTIRRGEEQSTTNLKWVNIEKPTQRIAGTSNLSNVKVMNERQDGNDLVESNLSKFFESEQVAELEAASMPEIGAEFVTKRVKLLADEADDPLKDAVEVMHYYREGLVSEEDAINAIESLIGNGETFVTGSESERKEAAADLVGG